MGLLSVSSTISCGSRAMEGATGVRLGGWRRIMPFLFSLPPRRHELYGSAKYVAMPGSSRSSACRANSVPSSCVTPVRAAAGSRAAARHGAAGMLHGEAPAHQRRRPAPARPLRDPCPQAVRRQAPRSTRNRLAVYGPAARGAGHVAVAGKIRSRWTGTTCRV